MYDAVKTALSEFLHLSKDALHIHIGILVYLAAAALTRRRLSNWLPWSVLLALELVNEWLDLRHDLGHGGLTVTGALGSIKDIVNTMLWPTVLMLALRLGWPAHHRAPDPRRGQAGIGAEKAAGDGTDRA